MGQILMVIICTIIMLIGKHYDWKENEKREIMRLKYEEEAKKLKYSQLARKYNEERHKASIKAGYSDTNYILGFKNTMPTLETLDKYAETMPTELNLKLRIAASEEANMACEEGVGSNEKYDGARKHLDEVLRECYEYKTQGASGNEAEQKTTEEEEKAVEKAEYKPYGDSLLD